MPDLLVISRPSDTIRRSHMVRVLDGLDWAFLDASDGHAPESLPAWSARLLAETFWDGPEIKPGAFGCFLSHYRAWQECLHLNRPLLVAEDDITLVADVSLPALTASCEGFDLTFLTNGVGAWRRHLPDLSPPARSGVLALRELVERLDPLPTPPMAFAPGAYLYHLTPKGAAALIANADANGSITGVDWLMVGCALSGAVLQGEWGVPGHMAQAMKVVAPIAIGVSPHPLADSSEPASVIGHGTLSPIPAYRARIGASP